MAWCRPSGARWFKTGDIGLFTADGSVRIVDRLKNLIKLKGGEYIAIENMEAVYGGASCVAALNGGVMCYGDGDMDRPVAFVQVEPAELARWADGAGVTYAAVEELCESPAAEKCVRRAADPLGVRASSARR